MADLSFPAIVSKVNAFNMEQLHDTAREYEVIRKVFHRLIFSWENSAERKDILEDIITLRASFLIDRALQGLRIDLDKALDILRNHNNFSSDRERQQRDILVVAVENLIDFAAAEEFTMLEEFPDNVNESELSEYENLCEKYNLTYAAEENDQVLFAASMAAWWLTVDADTMLTYMTQGDERVRAWHLSLEGLSYPKSAFPEELIPPIEWGCRCFLAADGFAAIQSVADIEDYRSRVDPVFRESLAKGGRIFSPSHRYFATPLPDYIVAVIKRLKRKFYHAEDNAR